MSPSDRDFERHLRRALHSAVDSVEPSEEGLDRIRARLTAPHPVPITWITAGYSEVARRARAGLESCMARLRTWRAAAVEHLRAARSRQLRPAAVLAIAACVAAAGVLALVPLSPQPISPTVAVILSFETGLGPADGTGAPQLNGHGAKVPSSGAGAAAPGHGKTSHSQQATARCAAATPTPAGPTPSAAASAEPTTCPSRAASGAPSRAPSPSPDSWSTPSQSPSPSPSPSSTPSQSPSPSPSPSSTPSETPAAGPTPNASP